MIIIYTILGTGIALWLLEQVKPAKLLPKVNGWYWRALLLNALQGVSAIITANTFDRWFNNYSWLSINALPELVQALVAYVVITFVYYWWHRARHQNRNLWRWLHQTHHSPTRMEVITSFYKHPLEVLVNGALSSAIIFTLLGLTPEAATLAVMFTGLAELFYHMNLSTPRWLGYFIQRPEMHRVHHQQGRHRHNYSDLPLWDMLFGTFHNPVVAHHTTGFPDDGETRLGDLLLGKRVSI